MGWGGQTGTIQSGDKTEKGVPGHPQSGKKGQLEEINPKIYSRWTEPKIIS